MSFSDDREQRIEQLRRRIAAARKVDVETPVRAPSPDDLVTCEIILETLNKAYPGALVWLDALADLRDVQIALKKAEAVHDSLTRDALVELLTAAKSEARDKAKPPQGLTYSEDVQAVLDSVAALLPDEK